MYLSKLHLDITKRDTARALYNQAIFHCALENCFNGPRQHPLWRVDGSGHNTFMLVLSHDTPDFSEFEKRFCVDGQHAETKTYDKFLESGFKNGDYLRFRLSAYPSVCVKKKNGKTGEVKNTRIPLNRVPTENHPDSCAENWVLKKLEKVGADVHYCELSGFTRKTAEKKNDNVAFTQATYDGVLQVTDRKKLAQAMVSGIGHEKAYGCGLLTVMPVC